MIRLLPVPIRVAIPVAVAVAFVLIFVASGRNRKQPAEPPPGPQVVTVEFSPPVDWDPARATAVTAGEVEPVPSRADHPDQNG
jgi:hypothetical protein